MSLLAALLVFSVLILFHEFGHFLLAKRGGICVVEFSLGMGPRLISFVKGGTRYSLKLFPFGGSCMMLGEDEELESQSEEERKEAFQETYGFEMPSDLSGVPFHETSAWTRFQVVAAGPFFNLILAFLGAFFIISFAGYEPPVVSQVMDGYPAQEAGLQEGDVIWKLNGKSIKIYNDITAYTGFHPGETLEVEYERDGIRYTAVLEPEFSEENGRYLMGISYNGARKSESVFTTLRYSVYELRYWVNMTFDSLKMIVKRQVSTDDIAGPVRIVSMLDTTVKETQQYGLLVVLLNVTSMGVLLSVNLAIMNLLPLPALDGGRLVFIVLEMLRGKPLNQELEGKVHMAGMAALMTLMVFILWNDVRNLL